MASNDSNSTFLNFPPSIPYVVSEVLVALCAVIGNALVTLVFYRERRLRRRTNYYIVSLAIADLLVGLFGIPFAILASVGLPTNMHACLFTVSLLVVLCTISIFCLVAVSVDRYWAILHPMEYSRNVSTKTAIAIIGVCWISGTLVGFLPLFGWHRSKSSEGMQCLFTEVMDYNYLVFLYFATIVAPAFLMAAFYAHIYRVILRQLRRIVTMNPSGSCNAAPASGGTMLRMLGPIRKGEVKATQNLSIIVLFFIICWIPLYTINCVQAFCPKCEIPLELTNFCIILSHANSAVNPLLYAYHLRDFRAALKSLLCCSFGSKGDNAGNCTQDRRFESHKSFQQYGVNTPTRNNSVQSLQNVRTLQQQQLFTECPTLSTRISSTTTATSPNTHLPLGPVIANMNSIHKAIADLPPVEKTADVQNERKRMWTLTEVSSSCEDDKHASSGHLALELKGETCVQIRNGTKRTSGQVNSAYIEDSLVLDYTEDDDEDVFVSGTVKTLSPNVAILSETPFVGNTVMENGCDIIQNLGTGFPHQSMEQTELGVQHKVPISKENPVVTSFSEYNSQLHRPVSCAMCDIDISNNCLDNHDKTELSPSLCRRKEVIVANSDKTNCNNAGVLRLGSENNVDSAEISDKNRTSVSSENLRLSPLKIVGEFLFHTNSKKSSLSQEEVSDESSELKKNDIDLKVFCDCHSTMQMQRLKDSETVQENGSVISKCEVTKCVDDMVM